jgi:hypothetical protein
MGAAALGRSRSARALGLQGRSFIEEKLISGRPIEDMNRWSSGSAVVQNESDRRGSLGGCWAGRTDGLEEEAAGFQMFFMELCKLPGDQSKEENKR